MRPAPFPDFHVAIIMDGNGRWATRRGLPRTAGHRRGGKAVSKIVETAPDLGIGTLTLFAFSADNWKRPKTEVDALMRLLERYLAKETARCLDNGVRLQLIGRRDRLSPRLVDGIEAAERATAPGTTLRLRIAVDYSARDAILRAARALSPGADAQGFEELLSGAEPDPAPDVDLLIRTGGEQRLSDFLLWECAWAELHFTPTLWPDFGARDLAAAVADFHRRERRFGRVPQPAHDAPTAETPLLDPSPDAPQEELVVS